MPLESIHQLPAFLGKLKVNAIVETPQGSQNKFDFDPDTELFELDTAMPIGVTFPFEFGFIPSTLAQDGDPLDILILMDAPTFVGCLVKVRLLGVIEAIQSKAKGKFVRNDRLIGVALESHRHNGMRSLRELPTPLLTEIEHFFAAYNEAKGRLFKVLGRYGPKRARALVKNSLRRAKHSRS
jgi:inorganic pyrophosphatase